MTIIIDDSTAYDYWKAYADDNRRLRSEMRENNRAMGFIFLKARQRRLLDAREYKILCMRFGVGRYYSGHSLESVGREFQVNRERVRQIESKALSKLAKLPGSMFA